VAQADVFFHRDGSGMAGFEPVTKEASAWFARNVASEAWQWLGNVLWVDSRFARELVGGLLLEA
jgi:hypothetical protein